MGDVINVLKTIALIITMVAIPLCLYVADNLNGGIRTMTIGEKVTIKGHKVPETGNMEFVFYADRIRKHVGNMESSQKRVTYETTLPMVQDIEIAIPPQTVFLHCSGSLLRECRIVSWSNPPQIVSFKISR